jgi:chemotaxis protein methyltransferase CheR
MLTDLDFETIRDYLAAGAGLVFDDSRRAGLSAVVLERMHATSTVSVDAYLRLVDGPKGEQERQWLLDAVTVQETYFFRNPPQMEALRRRILPELLRRSAGRDRPLTIWSAGCSTGEEPYTLAMLLLELSPMLGIHSETRIVGTDVSAQALDSARRGVYTGRAVETAPSMLRDRWFEPTAGGALAVRDEVRRLVDLRLHNLVAEPPPFGPGEVDLIVCRNVTIYFARDTTRNLVGGFHDVLAEGGYLLLGHSETLWQVSDAFTLVPVGDAFVYRRSHDARVAMGPSAPVLRPVRLRRPKVLPMPIARHVAAPGAAPLTDLDASRAALARGEYAEAVQAAEAAVAADPLSAEGYVVLGTALSTLGRDGDALVPLRKAVYLDPDAGHAHFMLASSLARLGQHGAAAISYRAAAASLDQVDPASVAAMLDGRDVTDLVHLCQRLADISEDMELGEQRLAEGRRGA